MNVYVLNGLNGIIDVCDTYESLIWNTQYFGESEFQLVVGGTPENVEKFKVGRYLLKENDYHEDLSMHNVMLIERRELMWDIEQGWKLTLTGGGLKNLLKRRVVWNQTSLTGKIEKVIRQVILDNVITPSDPNRVMPNFILDAEKGFSDEFAVAETDDQLSGEILTDWLVSVCQKYEIGWDVYIANGKYVFTLYKGKDRSFSQTDLVPVVFSPEYDNLVTSTYIEDYSEFRNAGVVLGEGEGSAQRIVSVGTATGMDRYELMIDGSSVSSNTIITLPVYLDMLRSFGNEQLSASNETEIFEGQVIANGLYTLGVDYDLGDVIQIENENKISAKSRITEVIYSEDENGITYLPTFGNWVDD